VVKAELGAKIMQRLMSHSKSLANDKCYNFWTIGITGVDLSKGRAVVRGFRSLVVSIVGAVMALTVLPTAQFSPTGNFLAVDAWRANITPVKNGQRKQPAPCRRGRLFFENCWWEVIRCAGRGDKYRCISCPDLPGGRCPR
jgi:hypothetical protein